MKENVSGCFFLNTVYNTHNVFLIFLPNVIKSILIILSYTVSNLVRYLDTV